MGQLNVDVSDAPPVKDIGGLAHPLVRHPLGAKEHGAAAVKHCHVGAAAALDIVPKHGRAFGRRNSNSESGKCRISSLPHLKRMMMAGWVEITMYMVFESRKG